MFTDIMLAPDCNLGDRFRNSWELFIGVSVCHLVVDHLHFMSIFSLFKVGHKLSSALQRFRHTWPDIFPRRAEDLSLITNFFNDADQFLVPMIEYRYANISSSTLGNRPGFFPALKSTEGL